MDNKLPEWIAPQLIRLNQVDGTEGGPVLSQAESVLCTSQNPSCNGPS